MVDPDVAFYPDESDPVAGYAFAAREWSTLAGVYGRSAERAWRARRTASALRLMIAEATAALRGGDRGRWREAVSFLAERHRLCSGFVAAEYWNRKLIREPIDAETAVIHAQVWRELGALGEVAGRYEDGIACCQRAVRICEEYSRLPGMRIRHVKALLQRAVIERLRGDIAAAYRTLGDARALANDAEVDPFTLGLLDLREGGIEIVVGRPDQALEAYRRAARAFDGVSENNLLLARLREVACLRTLNRAEEALAVTDDLLGRFDAPEGSAYRLGQVMLERAEVLQDIGDHAGVAAALEALRPHYAESGTLEAARWHRHVARHLISTGGDPELAARHLAVVLDLVTRPERADLTRTMLALHDLLRSNARALSSAIWSASWRAALLAADLQRTSLVDTAVRWSMHAQREEIYGGAVLIATELAEPETAAQIAETGRADVLNHVLTASPESRAATIGSQSIELPGQDPALADLVLTVGRLAADNIQFGRVPEHIPHLPLPGELPSSSDLDAMADLLVIVSIGESPTGWWSSVVTRRRGGSWRTNVRTCPPDLVRLVAALAAGKRFPPRGVTLDRWEQLGEFLLPDLQIWAGTPDAPQALVVVPDPRLWQVPYGALRRDGAYLVDVAEVVLAPSLRTQQLLVHRFRRTVAPVGDRPILSYLDPSMSGHDVEKAALDGWPAGHEPLSDLSASHRGGALLYVSGHGREAGWAPQFGPAAIALDTLAHDDLPGVVVLNGCWSGTAMSRFGQDPLSLAVGALLGGANTVVAGIGEVGSVASAHVGAAFVGLLRDGLAPTAALRVAQRGLRDTHPGLNPFDWAGLCAVGVVR